MVNCEEMFSTIETLDKNIKKVYDSGLKKRYDKNKSIDLLSLSSSDFFNLTYFLNAQKKSSLIEDYLIKKDNGDKIGPSKDRGDYISDNQKYIELKTSTTNYSSMLNIRQIRPWQEVDYYPCSFINELNVEKSRFYFLNKKEMLKEIELCGKPTHGTKTSNKHNKHIEYSISFPVYNDSHSIARRWNTNYLSTEYYDKVVGDTK